MTEEADEKQQKKHDEEYEAARKAALELMDKGFNMGGGPMVSRDELHERKS